MRSAMPKVYAWARAADFDDYFLNGEDVSELVLEPFAMTADPTLIVSEAGAYHQACQTPHEWWAFEAAPTPPEAVPETAPVPRCVS